jgi:hypothetical protein
MTVEEEERMTRPGENLDCETAGRPPPPPADRGLRHQLTNLVLTCKDSVENVKIYIIILVTVLILVNQYHDQPTGQRIARGLTKLLRVLNESNKMHNEWMAPWPPLPDESIISTETYQPSNREEISLADDVV